MPTIPSPLDPSLQRMKKDLLDAFMQGLEKIDMSIEELEPRKQLPPVPSPSLHSDYLRDSNVSYCLCKAKGEANASP